MSQRHFKACVDDRVLQLFRNPLLTETNFKELCKRCSIVYRKIENPSWLEGQLIKNWAIFMQVQPTVYGPRGELLENYGFYFSIADFQLFEQINNEKLLHFLHVLLNIRSQLLHQGHVVLNMLLDNNYIVPIVNTFLQNGLSQKDLVAMLETRDSSILGVDPLEINIFGEELYFERVAKGNFLSEDNESIIKSIHPNFDMQSIEENLQSQKIGEPNLKTILFTLRQIDIEIFDNLHKNAVVLFSLLKSSSLEIEGYLKKIKNAGLFKQLSFLLTGSFIRQFECMQNNQKNNEILNNAHYLLNQKSTMNPFFYHICFYYFSRNYLAHNHFMTRGNFDKMFYNNYELVKELYKSNVIIALIAQWKLIENGQE